MKTKECRTCKKRKPLIKFSITQRNVRGTKCYDCTNEYCKKSRAKRIEPLLKKKTTNLSGEIWRNIPGYEGLYQASNLGRIKSVSRIITFVSRGRSVNRPIYEKVKELNPHKNGYYHTNLQRDGKEKHKQVSRLIAETFIPNPKNKPEVNHINGIKTDNQVKNLEWVTGLENMQHAKLTGLLPTPYWKGKFGVNHHSTTPIVQMTKEGVIIRLWEGTKKAADTLLIGRTGISECLNGRRKLAGGFMWKFKNKKLKNQQ